MSQVFVDTSAVIALLTANDHAHEPAKRAFSGLRMREDRLVTTSFVLVEIYALLGRRLGLGAVRRFRENFAPLLEVIWIDRETCEAGLDLVLQRQLRDLSLVDAVSFVVVRQRRLDRVFAFDRHFHDEGFDVVR